MENDRLKNFGVVYRDRKIPTKRVIKLGSHVPSAFNPYTAQWGEARDAKHTYVCITFNFEGLGESGSFQNIRGLYLIETTRLSESQTRKPKRLGILLLIAALACYALWLIGLAARSSGYRIEFGSRKKAAKALSIISLARWWMRENQTINLSRRQINDALTLLCSIVSAPEI